MKHESFKRALYSLLIGALVAFLTTFIEGLVDWLHGWDNNVVGGASAFVYTMRKFHV